MPKDMHVETPASRAAPRSSSGKSPSVVVLGARAQEATRRPLYSTSSVTVKPRSSVYISMDAPTVFDEEVDRPNLS